MSLNKTTKRLCIIAVIALVAFFFATPAAWAAEEAAEAAKSGVVLQEFTNGCLVVYDEEQRARAARTQIGHTTDANLSHVLFRRHGRDPHITRFDAPNPRD